MTDRTNGLDVNTPEVVEKPKRRTFDAAYRLQIVEEADRCVEPGQVGQLLRREGLYSSHLTTCAYLHSFGTSCINFGTPPGKSSDQCN